MRPSTFLYIGTWITMFLLAMAFDVLTFSLGWFAIAVGLGVFFRRDFFGDAKEISQAMKVVNMPNIHPEAPFRYLKRVLYLSLSSGGVALGSWVLDVGIGMFWSQDTSGLMFILALIAIGLFSVAGLYVARLLDMQMRWLA